MFYLEVKRPKNAIKAFKLEFPFVKFLGCWFHFGQCLHRKLVELGFKTQYSSDEELKIMFKKCVALAIMPSDKIDLVFEEIIIGRSRSLLIKYPHFQKFLLYFIETWIGDEDTVPLYDRKLWNHWDTDLKTRTNNNNEAYNLRLEKKLGQEHPNIWIFVEGLQKEEVLISVDYVRVVNGAKKSRGKDKKEIQKDLDIVTAKSIYGNSARSFVDLEKLLDTYINMVPDF